MTAELPDFTNGALENSVPLSTLHHRIARELSELANICAAVENALGDIIDHPETTLDQPVVTLQGLDRLRQSLEDLARLSKMVSQKKTPPLFPGIPRTEIHGIVSLSDLGDRLTRPKLHAYQKDDADQDVFWLS